MITLYAFGPAFGLPEASPYVTKTEIQLKMAGLPYRKDLAGFAAAPKGKLPYIEDAGEIVADSTFIRAHLEWKYRVDLDSGLEDRQRAEAWAIERLIEDHLGWASLHARWGLRENFDKGPAHFFDAAPEAIRDKLREDVRSEVAAAMHAQGIGRHQRHEIDELGGKSLAALSMLLGDQPYMMGETACGLDAVAAAMLAGLLTPFFESPLRRRAESFANLSAYALRMMQQYYPEHEWTQRPAAARRASPRLREALAG